MRAYHTAPLLESKFRNPLSALAAGLDEALAAKLVDVLRSRRHHFLARRAGLAHVVDLFLAHSVAAQLHADWLATRIVELGAEPGFSPQHLAHSRAHVFSHAARVRGMAEDDLEATRATGVLVKNLVSAAGATDRATRRVLLAILEADKVRARELEAVIASPDAGT
jgi:bacterioferritin